MIAVLDQLRDMLEDLGGGLGVTDPVSGVSVATYKPKAKKRVAKKAAKKAAKKKPKKTAAKKSRTKGKGKTR